MRRAARIAHGSVRLLRDIRRISTSGTLSPWEVQVSQPNYNSRWVGNERLGFFAAKVFVVRRPL